MPTRICSSFPCIPTIMPQRRNLEPSNTHLHAYISTLHERRKIMQRLVSSSETPGRKGGRGQVSNPRTQKIESKPSFRGLVHQVRSLRKEKVMAVLVSAAETLQ
ncbi:hypothetical protein BHE74_00027397 [Ensete ventricosum]|nr:hypothetical protein BHE74_00027397 [Ensete ventricosum]RZS11243.1 hypothetical protein BHM03_00042562 [Ensete ventricosum]